MRRVLVVFAALTATSADAGDLLERARLDGIRREPGKPPVYLASLTPAHYFAPAPVLFQIVPLGGGGGGTTVAPGSTTFAACNANAIWYVDGSKVLQCNGPTYDNSGAGNGVFAFAKTPSGGAATSNFFNVTGTTPTTLTAEGRAVYLGITGAGSSAQALYALRTDLLAGFTGSTVLTAAGRFANTSANGGGADPVIGGTFGIISTASNNVATSWTVGGYFSGANVNGTGSRSVGIIADGTAGANSVTNIGGLFRATGGSSVNVGVYGFLASTVPFMLSAAGVFNNGTAAVPSLIAIDNSATPANTAAYAGWRVQDGGQPQNGLGVLTSATMAVETAAEQRPVIASYTWSNAQVVALGASTTGDITVATLPAKTQVRNAYVMITGAAAGPATVTVSCGDAIGGTPFINYIVASDAKAAANTVYGDAAAERGTSMDVEFYNLPSYTATTLVTCHFISTGANLDTVTGSTGRVVLETILLP